MLTFFFQGVFSSQGLCRLNYGNRLELKSNTNSIFFWFDLVLVQLALITEEHQSTPEELSLSNHRKVLGLQVVHIEFPAMTTNSLSSP